MDMTAISSLILGLAGGLAAFGVFFIAFLPRLRETERVKKMLADQDKGAKLLVRRDLELSRANEKLRDLDEVKSNFISVVAHQLRTPLSGIKWTLNMILQGELGPVNDDQKSFLMKGYESNDRMIALVNDMLSADRMESGKMKFEFVPIQLYDLLDNLLYDLLPGITKKKIVMNFGVRDQNMPKVFGDPEKLRAVLQNLLENAIKYTPQNGSITIDLKAVAGFVEVSIRDTGIGIPKEAKKSIFNRLFRASNAVKTVPDGSGLGLFMSKSMVEKHGGNMWFESEEGRGSTFHFTVPVVK